MTMIYVTALDDISSSSISQYCTPRHYPGPHFYYMHINILHSTSLPLITLYCKYITIVQSTSLLWDTLLLPIYHHTALYVIALDCTSSSISPYNNLHHYSGSYYYRYTTIFYSTSLSLVILLHAHHRTVLYVTYLVHTITSTPLYSSLHCCPVKYITTLHSVSLPWITLIYKYIAIVEFVSLPWAILLPVHHHTLLYTAAPGLTCRTSPYCDLGHCPGSHYFNKGIIILYSTPLP